MIGVRKAPDARTALELSSRSPTSATGSYAPYSVRLVDVTPYPQASRPTAPDEYVAQLIVSR